MLCGTGAMQGSIRWWSRNHRIHHRYTDQPQDPYNARQGFFYAHVGWLVFTKDWSKIKKPSFDISDLESDPMVMWQNKHYGWLAPVVGVVFPTLVCGLGWGDWWGGYFFASVARTVVTHHVTFCVNSLAHWFGDQPYADENTPRDHFLTALVTLGEGYHNFHHEFPFDYRNAIRWYQYDPTKWLIGTLYALGLAYDLKEFGTNEIQMGVWQMKQKKLDDEKRRHMWPLKDDELPTMDWFEFKGRCANGEKLIALQGHIVKVADWIPQHPGGPVLNEYIGKDATEAFSRTAHAHSAEAQGLAAMRRIAVLEKLEPVKSEKAQ
jgi:stearoyl-CoA desaturase (delta-9 desaturase)